MEVFCDLWQDGNEQGPVKPFCQLLRVLTIELQRALHLYLLVPERYVYMADMAAPAHRPSKYRRLLRPPAATGI